MKLALSAPSNLSLCQIGTRCRGAHVSRGRGEGTARFEFSLCSQPQIPVREAEMDGSGQKQTVSHDTVWSNVAMKICFVFCMDAPFCGFAQSRSQGCNTAALQGFLMDWSCLL